MHYQSLICTEPGQFEYRNDQLQSVTTGQPTALLRIKQVGICGTDLHAFEGTQPFFQYPRILGHEICAEVIEISGAPSTEAQYHPADLVTIIPYFSCGTCIACRRQHPNCCAAINVFGVHIDGGLRQYIQVPLSALVTAPGMTADQLALVEPLAIGAHAVKRAAMQKDEYALVMGAGPIGLGLMEMARLTGANVIAMDVNPHRLEFCREQLGIQHTINPLEQDAMASLKAITQNDMPTAVFDATGNLKAIEKGIDYLAHSGRYVLVGLQKQPISILHPEFHKREATLMSSRNATRADFDWVIDSLKNGLINPATYITHRIEFETLADQFHTLLNPANNVIKAMVNFG